jgi:hypothetical protein
VVDPPEHTLELGKRSMDGELRIVVTRCEPSAQPRNESRTAGRHPTAGVTDGAKAVSARLRQIHPLGPG